ncbi:ABC transporter permease [Nocardia spumae]|uniref:ABC transporter permease n=1 Tax=Nocardia spumae TaxID=2887190 RepID=UPI001D145C61|nr:ABC-2 family transporter protein [Nocardia spumae]
MRALSGVYPRLFGAGFRRQWNYRSAVFAGLTANVVFGLIRGSVMLAAVRSAPGFGGYTGASIGAYVWLSQGLLGALRLMGPPSDIAERVRTGDVAVDLQRPIDIQTFYLATDLGSATCTLILRGLPCVAVGLMTAQFALSGGVMPYLLGLVSVFAAVVLSLLLILSVGLAGFWLVETRGVRMLYQIVATFFGGLYVPVHLFPAPLASAARLTPFPWILQGPIDVMSGRATGSAAVAIIAVQLLWIALAVGLGRVLIAAGRRKLEVQGG